MQGYLPRKAASTGLFLITLSIRLLTYQSKNLTIGEMIKLGQAFSGNTIEELAQKTGMDPKKLRASIDTYNDVVTGKIKEDNLGFKKFTQDDKPMTEGPFYATPMVPAVHHTMGGIQINSAAPGIG